MKKGKEVWELKNMPGKNIVNMKDSLMKKNIKLIKLKEPRLTMTLKTFKLNKKSEISLENLKQKSNRRKELSAMLKDRQDNSNTKIKTLAPKSEMMKRS